MNGSCAAATPGVTPAVNSVALLIMSSPTACQPDINQKKGKRRKGRPTNETEQT